MFHYPWRRGGRRTEIGRKTWKIINKLKYVSKNIYEHTSTLQIESISVSDSLLSKLPGLIWKIEILRPNLLVIGTCTQHPVDKEGTNVLRKSNIQQCRRPENFPQVSQGIKKTNDSRFISKSLESLAGEIREDKNTKGSSRKR